MKSKIVFQFIWVLFIDIAAINKTFAQPRPGTQPPRQMPQQLNQSVANYSFRVFMASNKSFGYDILSNGKVIHHQPVFSRVPTSDDIIITKKEQATLAAMLSIEKIKKGLNPGLSKEELKKIVTR